MDKVQITWGITFQLWWAFTWRVTLFSMLLASIVGFSVATVEHLIGQQIFGLPVVVGLSQLGTIPVSIVVLKWLLSKGWGSFSINIIRK